MKKTMEKTLVILLITMLIASSMLVLQAYAEDVETEAFLDAEPNPVEVGTPLTITAWITPPPPEGENFHDVVLTITDPTGAYGDVVFNTDPDGYFNLLRVPDILGNWSLELHYPGEVFEAGGTYLGSDSDELLVSVQEAPIFIPPGKDITVYPHPDVVLTFDEVLTGGEVYVTTSYEGPPGYPLEGIGPYYYIEANPLTFTTVSIGIHYDDTGLTPEQETALTLWRFDPAVLVKGDVDGNGQVNLRDLFIIFFALGTRLGTWRWNHACDLNGDLKVNFIDLWIAFMNFGKRSTPAGWTDITTYVDAENNVVYGDTDHFSPYRVH